tara:strand:- start:346 stop:468 length:123 start_codon:yes stop_codon:yes gene_type:complete
LLPAVSVVSAPEAAKLAALILTPILVESAKAAEVIIMKQK